MSVNTEGAAIQKDAPLERDDAANAFLKRWEDAAEPSEQGEEEEQEVTEETVEEPAETPDEGDSNEEESTEEADDSEDPQNDEDDDSAFVKDDAKVKVVVDGEAIEVSVKDLKRLYGQEAALTKKSQAVSDNQKQLAQAQEYVEGTLEIMLAQAEESIKPYKDIDWVVASKRLNEEELTALREEAQKVYRNYTAVTEKVNDYIKTKSEQTQKQLSEVVAKTHEELSDPEKGIPNWGKDKYQELAGYAQSLGFPKEAIDTFVTAPVWKLLNKAMQFDKGSQVVTKKVNKTPQKTLKSTKRVEVSSANERAKAVLARMVESGGSRESAQDAFLARWTKK